MNRLRQVAAFVVLTLGSVVMLIVAIPTLGLARRFYSEVVEHLPYGAFPAFFYFFAGAAFKILKGRGLNLSRAIYPYFIGQLLFAPVLAFEKQLNFAMQTVVCRRPK